MEKEKILVTGANGQIGSELVPELRKIYGNENVIATDIKKSADDDFFEILDVLDKEQMEKLLEKHRINVIYHLASLLSAVGEKNPELAWDINVNGLRNVLEIAKNNNIKVFWPSSIAVFGPKTPKKAPQDTILQPTTMYGITKVTGELLCNYYHDRYNVDVRSLRFPGIISYKTLPGGGTTDYAVEIFYEAIKNKKYISFVSLGTILPMMYMPDCIKSMIMLMQADSSSLKSRCYNLAAMSFSVKELAGEIKKCIPEFECSANPDFRQKIADSWPHYIDDGEARKDWLWAPDYDIDKTTKDMIEKISGKLE